MIRGVPEAELAVAKRRRQARLADGRLVPPERRQSFNDTWRFLKSGALGAESPDFDDAGWRELRLPHDWAIEGPFDPKLNPHTGGLPISGLSQPMNL